MKAQQERMTHAPKRATPKTATKPADRLKGLLDNELAVLEQAIRQFQSKAASINSDAGYEVKRAADYFVEDTKTGIGNVMDEMAGGSYKPDEFAAAVLDGDFEDIALAGHETPADALPTRKGRALKATAEPIEVTAAPMMARSESKKARKI